MAVNMTLMNDLGGGERTTQLHLLADVLGQLTLLERPDLSDPDGLLPGPMWRANPESLAREYAHQLVGIFYLENDLGDLACLQAEPGEMLCELTVQTGLQGRLSTHTMERYQALLKLQSDGFMTLHTSQPSCFARPQARLRFGVNGVHDMAASMSFM